MAGDLLTVYIVCDGVADSVFFLRFVHMNGLTSCSYEICCDCCVLCTLQQGGDLQEAHYCFQKAAVGHQALRSPWFAAKASERAGESARDAGKFREALPSFDKAIEWYLEDGKPEAAAEAASKAAKTMEETDPKLASKYYEQALGLIEESGKDALHADIYRQAIAHSIRSERWIEGVALLLRFASSCDKCGAQMSQRKSYLGAIVVCFAAENARAAWETYQDALAVSDFASSDEAFAAEALFESFEKGDSEAIKECIKSKHCFSTLEPILARLARKLPKGGVSALAEEIHRLSGGLGNHMFEHLDEGDEDLT